jgi:hypothetical protein
MENITELERKTIENFLNNKAQGACFEIPIGMDITRFFEILEMWRKSKNFDMCAITDEEFMKEDKYFEIHSFENGRFMRFHLINEEYVDKFKKQVENQNNVKNEGKMTKDKKIFWITEINW